MSAFDFMQERFHNMSPGGLERRFIKAGDSEVKEGLGVEQATGQPRWSCFGSLEMLQEKSELTPLLAHWKVREKWDLEIESGG